MSARLINCSSARCARERALSAAIGVENREADLVVEVAGQNGMVVDDGDHAIENDRRARSQASGWPQPDWPACSSDACAAPESASRLQRASGHTRSMRLRENRFRIGAQSLIRKPAQG